MPVSSKCLHMYVSARVCAVVHAYNCEKDVGGLMVKR